MIRGSRPKPANEEESFKGALLGLVLILEDAEVDECSILGLEEKSEEIIWVGARGFEGWSLEEVITVDLGACLCDCDCSFRGRLAGRSS